MTIASIIAIVLASVLLGISEINSFAPSASAFIVVSKGGAIAGTHESSAGKPIVVAPHTQVHLAQPRLLQDRFYVAENQQLFLQVIVLHALPS
ncbi:hypothetical protein [Nitrososphaera sp. AFS]|uniref:hypothetical protein n=1 Tax=Nitrososphaera sp. AFS TaxID=2301191 RepID=UPI00139223DD|nr:hypothetical protein [Nitrososphaera sp. AFS]